MILDMKTFIYLLVGFAVLYMSRGYIAGWIMSLRDKKKETKKVVNEDYKVFAPDGTKRTFNISFDIVEQGDGTVDIKIAK